MIQTKTEMKRRAILCIAVEWLEHLPAFDSTGMPIAVFWGFSAKSSEEGYTSGNWNEANREMQQMITASQGAAQECNIQNLSKFSNVIYRWESWMHAGQKTFYPAQTKIGSFAKRGKALVLAKDSPPMPVWIKDSPAANTVRKNRLYYGYIDVSYDDDRTSERHICMKSDVQHVAYAVACERYDYAESLGAEALWADFCAFFHVSAWQKFTDQEISELQQP